MKQSVLITICAMLFAACTPNIPKPIENAKADFAYTISDKTVTFQNASTPGLSVYRWYFGDDTYNDHKETISHTYAAAGSYEVILQCKDANGYPYECAKTITISGSSTPGEDPGTNPPSTETKVYLKGFKVYDLPYTRATYRFKCNIYDWNGIAITATTDNQDISKSDLAAEPKTITFTNPKYITTAERFYYDYTAVEVIVLRLNGGSWKEEFKNSLSTEKNLQEYFFYNDAATIEVSALFDYKQ